jgi:hypothetical protein
VIPARGPVQPPTEPLDRGAARRDDEGRVYGVAGWVPVQNRRGVRARLRSARAIEAEHRRRQVTSRRRQREDERVGRRTAGYLPARGERRPQAGRAWWRLRVPPHRATSEVLAGAYPFLAEEGLGSAGILVGEDAWSRSAFCYDPWVLYEHGTLSNPNAILLGQIGRGKSALAKSLAVRCVAFGRRVYVPGDPKGEWSAVTRAVGGQVIELGSGRPTRLNPLDEGPRTGDVDDAAWRMTVTQRRLNLLGALAEATVGRPLGPTERTALDAALTAATNRASVPILPMVVDGLLEPQQPWRGSSVAQLCDDGRELAHALGRLVHGDLAGLFEGPSTVSFDPSASMVSLDLSHISGSDTLIALVHACTSTWMEAALRDPAGGQRLVIYDEAWRLMAQPSLLARMRAQWKLSRGWGLANLMIVHRLSDLDAVGDAGSEARGLALGLLGDTATRILYYEPHEEAEAAGRLLGLSSVEVRELGRLADGEGLWRVNDRAFVVRHVRTPDEKTLFNTDTRMVKHPHGFTPTEGASGGNPRLGAA